MTGRPGKAVRMAYLVACMGGIGFFAMSVLLLGVWPGRVLERETRAMSPEHPLKLTASEERGRVIYGREGCAYCHTQQVRYVESDMRRFGAPTLAWETQFDYPQLWGTRRIGPDLSREGSSRSQDWQYEHLYSPRSVVADSVMPAYPSFFDGSQDRPLQSARDAVAYIESLGRAREIAGPEGEARARMACNCEGDEMAMMAFHSKSLNASPAKTNRLGDSTLLGSTANSELGRRIYLRDCASCHGTKGEGDGSGARGLLPHPVNLTEHEYSLERLSFVLQNGVAGTAMPAWRDLTIQERSAVAQMVREFHQLHREPELPENIRELGAQVYSANCAQCHGEKGGGDGSAVPELRIVPANLQTEQPSFAASLRALRNGVEGTQMAQWTDRLSEAELSAVAYYVRDFYQARGAGVH